MPGEWLLLLKLPCGLSIKTKKQTKKSLKWFKVWIFSKLLIFAALGVVFGLWINVKISWLTYTFYITKSQRRSAILSFEEEVMNGELWGQPVNNTYFHWSRSSIGPNQYNSCEENGLCIDLPLVKISTARGSASCVKENFAWLNGEENKNWNSPRMKKKN